jgi:hypothetical protein
MSVITCDAGNWSTPTPTCIQDTRTLINPDASPSCPSITLPSGPNMTNQVIVPPTSSGQTIRIPTGYCADNYYPSPSVITCEAGGTWSTPTPTCIPDTRTAPASPSCPSITLPSGPNMTNEYPVPTTSSGNHQHIPTPYCADNYYPSPSVITCDAGNWSTPTPTCIQDPTICEYEYKYDITNGSYPIIIQNKDGPGFDETLHNSSLNDCENNCCGSDCFAWYFNHMNSTCGIINNLDGKYLDTGKPHTELSGGKSKTHVCPAIVIPSVANVPLSTPNTEIQMISLCPVDMKLSSPTITCSEDGTWSTLTPTPTCIPNA